MLYDMLLTKKRVSLNCSATDTYTPASSNLMQKVFNVEHTVNARLLVCRFLDQLLLLAFVKLLILCSCVGPTHVSF